MFALGAALWGWLGPVGWPATAAFVLIALVWAWLARRSFENQTVVQAFTMFSSLWFVLGCILVVAFFGGNLLRGLL
jgi:hypothetical protein